MYKITMSDRSVVITSTVQGDKIKEAQMQVSPPKYIEIDKNQYRLERVAKIEYMADEPVATKALPQGRVSHEHSIHREIYYLFKKELLKPNPRKWEEFYPKAYDYLYTQKKDWCDYKKGTCVCDQKTVERVSELMGAEVELVS